MIPVLKPPTKLHNSATLPTPTIRLQPTAEPHEVPPTTLDTTEQPKTQHNTPRKPNDIHQNNRQHTESETALKKGNFDKQRNATL
mmetsp:Transcript_47178/g.56765  ORF Transcript_47178/g.56765 Transcript_47178/m.56765 type:complete len:85 (-) Transcript_47178:5-259(-)